MIDYTDTGVTEKPIIYFVGLSAKVNCEPLSIKTNTGKIVNSIEEKLPDMSFVLTNLVQFPPIDNNGKLRYPNMEEMRSGWCELKIKIRQTPPTLLILLGQQVSLFLRSEIGIKPVKPSLPQDFTYQSCLPQSNSSWLCVHHPSFVYVYRRKQLDSYIENVALSVSLLLEKPEHLTQAVNYLN
jgi:hypothetical protein